MSATLVAILSVAACQADAAPSTSLAAHTAPSAPASPAAGGPTTGLDVPTWKGGITRTGVNPGPGPAAEPVVLWDVRLDAMVESQPLVIDGTVIVATTDGDLLGIDADTGKPAWDTVHLPAGVKSQPAVDAGALYLVTDDGMLHAMSLADRSERWPAVPGFDPFAVVAVADGRIIAGRPGELVAVRAADGTEAWHAEILGSTHQKLAVDGGFAYVTADSSGDMSKVDLADREHVEQLRLGGADGGTASLDPDGVVVGYRDVAGGVNGVVAFGHDGTQLWRHPSFGDAHVEGITIADDVVLVATEEPARIEARSRSGQGEVMWDRAYGGSFLGGNVVAGGVLYLVATEEGLIAVDLATHETLWSVPFEASQKPIRLVVTDGLIIASAPTVDGAAHVVAFADPTDRRSTALHAASPVPTVAPSPSADAAPIYEVLDAGATIEGENVPASPSLGPDGTLYIADMSTNRVLVRAPDGTISWWGEPGSGNGQFDFSVSGNVSVSPDGALIAVADGGNRRVQLFDARRGYITQFGRLGDGPRQFKIPRVTVDSRHRIWVVDSSRNDIQLFNEDTTYVDTFAGTGDQHVLAGGGDAFFREATGELYVPDFDHQRVSVFNDHGWVRDYGSRRDEGLNLTSPNKVVVDDAGRMFVVDTTSRIHVLSHDGHPLGRIPSDIPGVGPVDVSGFDLDGDGRLYLWDVSQRRIVVLQLLPPLWPPPG
jgi:outer membrane protein assembly factor BamB